MGYGNYAIPLGVYSTTISQSPGVTRGIAENTSNINITKRNLFKLSSESLA